MINKAASPPVAPRINFTWSPLGSVASLTLGGNTYPYTTQADSVSRSSDTRYASNLTPTNTSITFTSSAVTVNSSIVRYRWDFGDGTESYGPTAQKTFKVSNPTQAVTLVAYDSNGLSVSVSHTLNLVPLNPPTLRQSINVS